jgi:PKD repeat protein
VNDTIFFNASTSTAAPGHTIVSFKWAFGDGGSATGVTATHAYATAGTYVVQLSLLDESGQGATSAGTTITIGGASPSAPSANFTISPTDPVINDLVVFDSSSTTVASGQSIVDVAWNFGDDTPIIHGPAASTRITSHVYARAGNFVVNLVVTDSVGRTGQKNLPLSVGTGNPAPVITFSPGAPHSGDLISFDSIGTRTFGGATIASYLWSFPGATFTAGTNASAATARYVVGASQTFVVRLTVTDSIGRVGSTTVSVTVVP